MIIYMLKIYRLLRGKGMNLIDKMKTLVLANEAASIGSFEQSEEQNKLWQEKKELCKKNAIPRQEKVSGNEIKNYLINQHGAEEIEFPQRIKQMFKTNLLYDLHPEIFPASCFPPKKGGNKAFLKWVKVHNEKEIEDYVRDIPDKKYGLNFCYLELSEKDVKIYLELTTGHMQLSSTWYDTTELFREIVLWIGITKEDIDKETSTFMIYADEFYHSTVNQDSNGKLADSVEMKTIYN